MRATAPISGYGGTHVLFNSIQFLIFFPVVTALYFGLPQRFRWALLLLASCCFYMAFRPVYILILVFTILVDYIAGLMISSAQGSRRKLYLLVSICANVGVLAFFKYYNFLTFNFIEAGTTLGFQWPLSYVDIILPIGLSFHTFQSLSYTIEVYRGRYPVERNLGIFALYVMFYPQLVAGPIERPQNLLHQFYEYHAFDYGRVTDGLKLMTWGLFKKVVIADRLAPFVNQVYDDPLHYRGISLIVATVLFAFQIYCDFSGYSDIAIGAAQVMGFQLVRNFNKPYFSTSISEFWRCWHISLSTWFRDYMYIPLGGNRVSTARRYVNLMITFLVSGLWHGANWTYVIWGGLNGLYLVAEQIIETAFARYMPAFKAPPALAAPWRLLRMGITFTLVCFAWIFFRAKTTTQAFYIVSHLSDGLSTLPADLRNLAFLKMNVLMRLDKNEYVIGIAAVGALIVIECLQHLGSIRVWLGGQPAWLRWSLYYGAASVIVFFGAFNKAQEFIYFQF